MAKRKPTGRKRLFENLEGKTHMPFSDGVHLVFCRAGELVRRDFRNGGAIWSNVRRNPELNARFAKLPRTSAIEYRAWKVYHTLLGQSRPERLLSGLPEDAVECSPSFFEEDGLLHVSFIGGVPTPERIDYRLYEMTGRAWSSLSAATPALDVAAKIGFISPKYVCYGSGAGFILRDRVSGSEKSVATPLVLINRASFRADDPNQIILTGFAASSSPQSFIYNVETGALSEITSDGPVYKPTLFGPQMIHAQREATAENAKGASAFSAGFARSAKEGYSLWQQPYSIEPAKLASVKKTEVAEPSRARRSVESPDEGLMSGRVPTEQR